MFSSRISVTTLFLSIAIANASNCPSIACDDVHFFLARGNNEPYPGRQAALVAATCDGLSSCGYEDLIYSSLYTDLSCQSTYDGAIAGHVQMDAYASACPNSKLILAGYSEGAAVATDILGGGGGVSFNGCVAPDTPPMDRTTKPGSQIVAAIVFGNERHTAGQSYNFGNGSAIAGLFPRPASQLSGLDAYAGVLRDWCLADDPICAANQAFFLVSAHLGYYDMYSEAAASWIKSVASLTDDSNFVTTIPISVSGTVQNYATVGTATPSGTVTIDTTWTQHTAVVPCSGASTSTVSRATSSSVASESPMSSSSSQNQTSGSPSISASLSSTIAISSSAVTTAPATLTSQTTTQTSTSVVGTSSSKGAGNRETFASSVFVTLSVVIIVSIYT